MLIRRADLGLVHEFDLSPQRDHHQQDHQRIGARVLTHFDQKRR